jgi:hypothetical protein
MRLASIAPMSSFANTVIGALLFSAAFAGLIVGVSLIVCALLPPAQKKGDG